MPKSAKQIIVISPSEKLENESKMINDLFDRGLYRYHLSKENATEQSIAEILENIEPKFLPKITLHTHYHLVLAFGVGGIHFTENHRLQLGQQFLEKIKLYQGFGIVVSGEVKASDLFVEQLDYIIGSQVPKGISKVEYFILSQGSENTAASMAFGYDFWYKTNPLSILSKALDAI